MGFMDTVKKESSFSEASGQPLQYVVLQVTLKEKFLGTGSGNLTELENVINKQASKGYRLHTISTASGGSTFHHFRLVKRHTRYSGISPASSGRTQKMAM